MTSRVEATHFRQVRIDVVESRIEQHSDSPVTMQREVYRGEERLVMPCLSQVFCYVRQADSHPTKNRSGTCGMDPIRILPLPEDDGKIEGELREAVHELKLGIVDMGLSSKAWLVNDCPYTDSIILESPKDALYFRQVRHKVGKSEHQ